MGTHSLTDRELSPKEANECMLETYHAELVMQDIHARKVPRTHLQHDIQISKVLLKWRQAEKKDEQHARDEKHTVSRTSSKNHTSGSIKYKLDTIY